MTLKDIYRKITGIAPKRLAATLLLAHTAAGLCANDKMPLIAFMGPVVDHLTLAEYQDMARCGFTHTLNIYNTLEKAQADLQRAAQAGIRIYVHTPQLVDNPRTAAQALKGSPALAGYFLADEPNYDQLDRWAEKVRQVKSADAAHPCYVNLHPYYEENQLRVIGARDYRLYVQAASAMGLPQISFDFYPVTHTGMRPTWFYTLGEIRRESLRRGVPFWGFVLTVPHGDYPAPTWASLRLQAYVNLVYGAQALEYFTYRTPVDDHYHFHDAPIGTDGKKTRNYYLVKAFNEELAPVADFFYGARVLSTGHLIKIPAGSSKFAVPSPVRSLVVKGKKGAVASLFSKNGHTYLALVNKDYKDSLTLSIAAATTVKAVTKKLRTEPLKATYTLAAGDIQIFRIK